ncbi:MAG: hypothetical protein NUV93_07875 [Firmicutes bacterium]|jgi:membrane protein DedA with SNARE-associated domain|nr:hypothetical protein [Bacillota bacterium]
MILSRGTIATLASIAGAIAGRMTVRLLGFPGLGVLGCIAGAIAGYLVSRRLMEIRGR